MGKKLITTGATSVAHVPAGLTCTGEIDLAVSDDLVATCHHLLDDLAPSPGTPFLLDLSRVTFMDSAGLEALLRMVVDVEERHLVCLVAPISAPVRRILELADRLDLVTEHQAPAALGLPA